MIPVFTFEVFLDFPSFYHVGFVTVKSLVFWNLDFVPTTLSQYPVAFF